MYYANSGNIRKVWSDPKCNVNMQIFFVDNIIVPFLKDNILKIMQGQFRVSVFTDFYHKSYKARISYL